ncbi:hypothetical protein V6N13_038729 [Hibiscus sabdariffa]|uniref:Uncharacterized protein n=2 Tax=Hibiscus sabdariffa TaxID=183260 RepID=A0ABR2P3A4_9ROSI
MSGQLDLEDALFDVPNSACCVDAEVPILLGSKSFQSKEGKGAQNSLILLLLRTERGSIEDSQTSQRRRVVKGKGWVGFDGNVSGSSDETAESDALMVEIHRESVEDKAMA